MSDERELREMGAPLRELPGRKMPPAFRARVLLKAAAELRRQRFLFDALEVYEAGKPWIEADADVAEALDFLEYYARQAVRLAGPVPTVALPGEEDEAFYIPLGVGAIIPPWNFPCSILTGMTMAPVAAGNAVIVKPASNTPVIAYKLFEMMEEAGAPAGVVNYLPGGGGEIGDFLVEHPQTRFIAFTGSKTVGVRINERAARLQPGHKGSKTKIGL